MTPRLPAAVIVFAWLTPAVIDATTASPDPVGVAVDTAPDGANPTTLNIVAQESATEYVEVPATPTDPLIWRGPRVTDTPTIRPGLNGSSLPGRCTQYEPLLAEHAPPSGWDVNLMSSFMHRESKCCPQVATSDGWRTTQGGDRYTPDCEFTHIAERDHRSDAGLLQVNGINYQPHRCANTCLSDWLDTPVTVDTLGDPVLNIAAAAALCEFWVNAGSSCYRPWRG